MQGVRHIYSPPLIQSPGLSILGLGIQEMLQTRLIIPCESNAMLLLMPSVDIHIAENGNVTELLAKNFLIMQPHSQISIDPQDSEGAISWFLCTGSAIREQMEMLCLLPDVRYPTSDFSGYLELLRYLDHECLYTPQPNPLRMTRLVFDSLVRMHRAIFSEQHISRIPDVLLDVKQHIESCVAESLTLAELAEFSCLSMSHLSREFKKYFCHPPIDYQQHMRMLQSLILLYATNYRVTEIAQQVGYSRLPHFLTFFRKHFGMTPRQLRQQIQKSPVTILPSNVTPRPHELDRWLREGWKLLLDFDYAQTTSLAPQWKSLNAGLHTMLEQDPYHYVIFRNGCMELVPHEGETMLCWNEELIEELKLEVRVITRSPEGINLSLSISGDLHSGYRLRIFGYHHLALETLFQGRWDELYRCQIKLSQIATVYDIAFWRSENTFYVDINGERVLEYYDPMAPQGSIHRTFALGRNYTPGGTAIRHLRVFQRMSPRYTDILERGRTLLNYGLAEEAYAWCRRIALEHDVPSIRHEAWYLAALALPTQQRVEKITLLQNILQDGQSLLRVHCLRKLTLLFQEEQQIDTAIQTALALHALSPFDGVIHHLAECILQRLHGKTDEEVISTLKKLAQLPLHTLSITWLKVSTLAPIQMMPLTTLNIDGGHIGDLSVIRRLPLHSLIIQWLRLPNLELLCGMTLSTLNCNYNHITDISMLKGMPLQSLNCAHNMISDLSPLCGCPLFDLKCSYNQVRDLSPLRGMPLRALSCRDNVMLDDVSALKGMSLENLYCDNTAVADLTPLFGMPLHILRCSHTPVTDLSPLKGMPLHTLNVGEIPWTVQNREIVRSLPLHSFACVLPSLHNISILMAHPTLKALNGHDIEYARKIMAPLCHALDAWSHSLSDAPEYALALSRFAVISGETAYLSLPVTLTWEAAVDFCTWLGGRLICLETPEKYHEIQQYLLDIIRDEDSLYYHIGITDCMTTPQWLSNTPFEWNKLPRWFNAQQRINGGHAYFTAGDIEQSIPWDVHTLPAYVLVEWQMDSL